MKLLSTVTKPLHVVKEATAAAHRLSRRPPPQQNPVEQFINGLIFAANTANVPVLRGLARVMGNQLRVFGGQAYVRFNDVRSLMAREPEKIDWFSGPLQDRADYLTKSYMPFVLAGPNHRLRRRHIVGKIARAHSQLDDLETLLDEENGQHERALPRFLFRHFCGVELTAHEVDWYLEFRRIGPPMVLLPKILRTTLLRGAHKRLQEQRLHFLRRIEDAGTPISDTWFDVIWFNAGTLGSYPERALQTLREQPALRKPIQDELALPPAKRLMTRALVHEMLRIYGRIASTNHVEEGRVRIALIASALVDPTRYRDPMKVDLERDHSDTPAFAGAAPSRGCPAEHFAPDVMATVVAYHVRNGWLSANAERQSFRPLIRRDKRPEMVRAPAHNGIRTPVSRNIPQTDANWQPSPIPTNKQSHGHDSVQNGTE